MRQSENKNGCALIIEKELALASPPLPRASSWSFGLCEKRDDACSGLLSSWCAERKRE